MIRKDHRIEAPSVLQQALDTQCVLAIMTMNNEHSEGFRKDTDDSLILLRSSSQCFKEREKLTASKPANFRVNRKRHFFAKIESRNPFFEPVSPLWFHEIHHIFP